MLLLFFSILGNAQPKIRFGIIDFYPPFAFSAQSGYIHGYDYEVAKTICQKLNYECTFTPMPLAQLFTSLKENSVDAIIGAISITPERQALFDFTAPYFNNTFSYVTLYGINLDPHNLQGQRVGVIKDSTFADYLINKFRNTIALRAYTTTQDLVTALSNKEVDIIVLDTPTANYWVRYSTYLFQIRGNAVSLPSDHGYGIAVSKGNLGLLNDLNRGLNIIKQDGTLVKISQVYFSRNVPLSN